MGQGFGGLSPGGTGLSLPLWKTQWGLSPGGTGYPCRCGKLNGGFPPAVLAIPAAVVPEGGLLFWSPVAPAFSFVFAPYPPSPLPRRGRGRPKLFFARGFAPCIPSIRPPAALARPATAFARRGAVSCRACFARRINAFLPPIPPTRARRALFPGGEGGDQSYFMQGASPLASPGLNPGGTYRTRQAGARSGALPLARRGWRFDTRRERGS